MPRPKFDPDPDQRRILEALAELAERRAAVDTETEQLIAEADRRGIPVSVIAAAARRGRKTVYRRLGHDM